MQTFITREQLLLIILGLGGLGLAGAIFYIGFRWESFTTLQTTITRDLDALECTLRTIDRDAGILGFDYDVNPINFLNIKSFTGSEVGSMNLAYPEGWKQEYMFDNPTIQGKEYVVVQTPQGFFITPGVGVRLPNNKVIGTDIPLTGTFLEYAVQQRAQDPTLFDFVRKIEFKGRSRRAKDTVSACPKNASQHSY